MMDTDRVLEHDGRALTDDERQAARVLLPKVASNARDLASRLDKNLSRGDLARALHTMAGQLAQINQVVLRSTVAGDQAEVKLDDLRRHVVAVHANGAGMDLPEEELKEFHHGDHTGPGGIRYHHETSHYWDPAMFAEVMAETSGPDA